MNILTKKRVIRDFDKLDIDFQKQILSRYPYGLSQESMSYLNINGKSVATISYETDDTYYLLRLPSSKPLIRIKKDDYGVEYVHLEEMKDDESSYDEPGYEEEEDRQYDPGLQNYDNDEDDLDFD